MSKGLVSLDALAARLGVGRSLVEALLAELASRGYLEEVVIDACGSCPLRRICPLARLRRRRVRLYRLVRRPEWCRE